MRLPRRRFLRHLTGASAALLTAHRASAQASDAMQSTEDQQSMQVAQRGGLYANLKDPLVSQLPPGAFAQRFTYSPAPRADNPGRWISAAPLPLPRSEMAWAAAEGNRMPRDHAAPVVLSDRILVAGGRMDTFDFNTGMHVAYDPAADRWEERAPMPTPRSGLGGVAWRDRFFCMGGEGTRRVFGQNEAYDPRTDTWQAYAPMLTPRHGMAAAVLDDGIHVAGGGPMNGGAFQTSVHEVFAD